MSARHAAAPLSTDQPTPQFGNQARPGLGFAVGLSGHRLDRARTTARQSAGEPKHRGVGVSQARWLGDAVDPAALLLGRGKSEPELFLQRSREDTANGMTLPAGHARHFVDRWPRGKAREWVAQRRSSLPTPARLWLIRNVQPGKPFPTIAIWDANKTLKSAPGRRCCRERGAANRAPGRRRPVRFVRRADRLSVRNAKQA